MALQRPSLASLFIVLALGLIEFRACVNCDDEVCITATDIGNPKRAVTYVLGPVEKPMCDESLDNDGWYKFGDSTNERMPESCVDSYHCGSEAPIWMNGSHPTAADPGPVKRQTCGKISQKGPCCEYTAEMQVKWCQNQETKKAYFVYQLKRPTTCELSYCAGVDEGGEAPVVPGVTGVTGVTSGPVGPGNCDNNCAWNDVISACSCPSFPTTEVPVLEKPVISSTKTVKDTRGNDFIATRFSIRCVFGYEKKDADDGARFLVSLESNGQTIINVTKQSTEPFVDFDEGNLIGRLGTDITCSVSSFWSSSNPQYSPPQTSNVLWFGLQAVNEQGEVIHEPVIKDGEVFAFKFQSTFPITSPQCFVTSIEVPCQPIYIFKIAASKSGRVCACRFLLTPMNNATDLITVSPAPIVGSRTKPFLWEVGFVNETHGSDTVGTMFEGYTIQSIMVQIEDSGTRPLCSSTGYSHVTTFPTGPSKERLLYNIYMSGDFSFVKAEKRNFEVHVRKFPYSSTVSSTCAVMVREGNNILGIDACQRGQGAEADWSPRLVRLLLDPVYPSGEIEPTGSGWTIMMLSGIRINVDQGFTPGILDVYAIGLGSETYGGLCSYSGTQTESCTTDCEQYRVPESESLFNYNSANQPQCGEPYIIPTCDCYQGETENSINVTCPQPKQSNLLKTGYRCDIPSQNNTDSPIPTVPKPPTVTDESTLDEKFVQVCPLPPNKNDGTVTPVWPTPNNRIDEPQAKEACNNAMTSSPLYSKCSGGNEIALQQIVDDCVRDIQLADDLSPAKSVRAQLERFCVYEVEKNCTFTPEGKTPESNKPLEELLWNICPNQCSNRGKCDNGSCVCDSGYVGSDCGLVEHYVPQIVHLLPATCILGAGKDCSKVYAQTNESLSSQPVSCKFINAAGDVKIDTSPIVSGGVVICSLPFEVVPGIYLVSLSIDGTSYGVGVEYEIFPPGATPPTATVVINPRRTTPPLTPPGPEVESAPTVLPTSTPATADQTTVPPTATVVINPRRTTPPLTPSGPEVESAPTVLPTSTPATADQTTVPPTATVVINAESTTLPPTPSGPGIESAPTVLPTSTPATADQTTVPPTATVVINAESTTLPPTPAVESTPTGTVLPTSTPATADQTAVHTVGPCPDLGPVWDEFGQCFETAKTTPPGNDPCPNLAAIGDTLVQCIHASLEKAKPIQARK